MKFESAPAAPKSEKKKPTVEKTKEANQMELLSQLVQFLKDKKMIDEEKARANQPETVKLLKDLIALNCKKPEG